MKNRKAKVKLPREGGCVYCGSMDSPSDEHTIPVFLGGTEIIESGSCRKCAKETSRFELSIARNTLGNYRIKWGGPSQNTKKAIGNLYFETMGYGVKKRFQVSKGQHPGSFSLFIFSPPRLISLNIVNPEGLHEPMRLWHHHPPESTLDTFTHVTEQVYARSSISISALAKLLAKMAHCHCIVEYGQDAFSPFLTSLIRGLTPEYADYVGGSHLVYVSQKPSTVAIAPRVWKMEGVWYVSATIFLFSPLGGPSYEVIVGRCTDQNDARWLEPAENSN